MILEFQAASKDFNIRLMMVLMKNLIDFNIADVFPSKDNVTVVADLSRIKYLRNKIAHNSDMSITDEDFDKDWKHLSEVTQKVNLNKAYFLHLKRKIIYDLFIPLSKF